MLILLVIILSLVSLAILAISLALLFPLTSALVRFRANYNPKGLQLDPEGDGQPYTGPVITFFFSMLKRVHSIEVRSVVGPLARPTYPTSFFFFFFKSNLWSYGGTSPMLDLTCRCVLNYCRGECLSV